MKTLGKRFLSKDLERKCETPAGKTCQGETPRRKGAEEASRDRPLKASAWSGNQHPNGTGKAKTVDPII